MSSDNPNPEQAQAKIATALGRLRGDVMPPITSQAAPRLAEQPRLSDQIGTTPLPTASSLRAEPTLGAAANSAPANMNPATTAPQVAPMTAGNPAPVSPASLGGANGPATGSLGNNASGSSYLGNLNAVGNATGNTAAGSQPDLLAGVDMGPPPLGADYPRAEADDGRRKRNRRLVGIAAVVAAVVIVGFWFTTRHRGEVPEIAADTSPEKVKPTDQGGLQVPNQNVQVLENMNGQPKAQAGETVLPPPEQPVAPPAVTDQTAAANPAAPATAADTAQQAAQTAPAAPAVPSVQAPAVPASPTTGTTAAATPTAPAVPAVPAVPAANSSAMTSTPAVPATTVASAANTTAAPSAAPTTATTTAEPAAKTTTTAAPAGKLRIQLAAVKTEEAAKSTWTKLQKAHPAQLGNLSLMVEKVDKGAAGIFYRVQAGPFSDTSAAKSVCSALSAQGQACILAH
jgi:hypothetical protein